jgi:hypothetical protein
MCSVSVPQLEKAWAKKSGIPVSQAREPLKRFLGALIAEKRNAPSLSQVKADNISDHLARISQGGTELNY